ASRLSRPRAHLPNAGALGSRQRCRPCNPGLPGRRAARGRRSVSSRVIPAMARARPGLCRTSRRNTSLDGGIVVKIHDYQGKEILKKYGVAVPRGIPCFSVDEAVKAAET